MRPPIAHYVDQWCERFSHSVLAHQRPQITRALDHDVTSSVTITTAKITDGIRSTWPR
jgi:hypothetical protein